MAFIRRDVYHCAGYTFRGPTRSGPATRSLVQPRPDPTRSRYTQARPGPGKFTILVYYNLIDYFFSLVFPLYSLLTIYLRQQCQLRGIKDTETLLQALARTKIFTIRARCPFTRMRRVTLSFLQFTGRWWVREKGKDLTTLTLTFRLPILGRRVKKSRFCLSR